MMIIALVKSIHPNGGNKMGKRLIIQRRGRGTPTYKSASHRFRGKIAYRSYDEVEKEGSLKGKVSGHHPRPW